MMIIFIIITFIIPLVSIYSTWTKHILNSTNVPTGMRWTSWLFTIAAKELNLGLPKNTSSKPSECYLTRDLWITSPALELLSRNTFTKLFPQNLFKLGCILCMLHRRSLAWVSKVSKPPWKHASMFQLPVDNFTDWHFHTMNDGTSTINGQPMKGA